MEISIKDLNAVMEHMNTMAAKLWETAESTIEMAKGIQAIIDDCATQLKAKKEAGPVNGKANVATEKSEAPAATNMPDQNAIAQNEPAKKITLVELRAYVAERSSPQTRPKIKEILTRFGAAKLTELPEEQYSAVMDEVAKL